MHNFDALNAYFVSHIPQSGYPELQLQPSQETPRSKLPSLTLLSHFNVAYYILGESIHNNEVYLRYKVAEQLKCLTERALRAQKKEPSEFPPIALQTNPKQASAEC